MRRRLTERWQRFTIRQKIGIFVGTVFLIISTSVLFELWIIKFSLVDFNAILEDNAKSSELVSALEEEGQLFEAWMKSTDREEERRKALEDAFARTKEAVYDLPFDYGVVGEERYARTWSIRSSYQIYQKRRDAVLFMEGGSQEYVRMLYEVYDMQSYLQAYADALLVDTLEAGNLIYQKRVPWLVGVPLAAVLLGFFLMSCSAGLSSLMNKTLVSPVIKLVRAAKKIASNDFFIEDVTVLNRDELGELVAAFNKMKYATGEYILALEEKRKMLDLLHEEELEKLEAEKRLETMKLELLKNQIQPHFLFNTLNVIGGMANLEGATTTEKMIRALGSLFRYNLKVTDVEVSLAQELGVVKDYLYLQQMRFGSRIAYDVDCRVNEELVKVPVFTFQPLVENAVIHGLSKKEEGGRIRLRILQRGDFLWIAVGDTGAGMEEGELRRIREHLGQEKKSGKGEGIGLGNIDKRIRAMYPEGRVEIFSKKNAGTVIKIGIPQKAGSMDVPYIDRRRRTD